MSLCEKRGTKSHSFCLVISGSGLLGAQNRERHEPVKWVQLGMYGGEQCQKGWVQ